MTTFCLFQSSVFEKFQCKSVHVGWAATQAHNRPGIIVVLYLVVTRLARAGRRSARRARGLWPRQLHINAVILPTIPTVFELSSDDRLRSIDRDGACAAHAHSTAQFHISCVCRLSDKAP